ncbi:MAG: DNA polymerase III subunit epsilon [Beijerinckiaceae bacterium]
MREIIFDTETTGLSPLAGDRLVEIGCIELVNRFPTGRVFHKYINPERDMPKEAFDVHGLSSDFLRDKPVFAEVAEELHAFLVEAKLVAHNASFDMGFLNAEFDRVGKPAFSTDVVIDTVQLARRKFPGAKVSLDALCDRFGIDRTRRTKHGALLDAEFLAEVYSELLGGKQTALGLDPVRRAVSALSGEPATVGPRRTPLAPLLSEAEITAHAEFVKSLGEKALWNRYVREG